MVYYQSVPTIKKIADCSFWSQFTEHKALKLGNKLIDFAPELRYSISKFNFLEIVPLVINDVTEHSYYDDINTKDYQ